MHVLFCIFFKHRFTQLILILPNCALYFFPTSTNITSLTKTTYSSANFCFFKWSLIANQKFNYQLPINSAVQSSIPLCQVQIKWLLYLLMPTLLWILFWFCLTVIDPGIGDKYVVEPWYQFLEESDFSHDDEISFYYRRIEQIWEIVIRHQKDWDDSNTK